MLKVKKNRLYNKPGTRPFLSDKKSVRARVACERMSVLRKVRDRKTERKTTQEIAPKTVCTADKDPIRLSGIEGSCRSATYLNGSRKKKANECWNITKMFQKFLKVSSFLPIYF